MSKIAKRVNARQFWLTAQERHLVRVALMTLRAGTDSNATYVQEKNRNVFVSRRIDDLHAMLQEVGASVKKIDEEPVVQKPTTPETEISKASA